MKKLDRYKTIQLILFILITVAALYIIFIDRNIYYQVAQNRAMKSVCALLWVSLGASFFFIYMDFTYFFSYKRDYKEMDYAIHSDPMSGIANRYSCDMLIEKYLDKPLPEDMGCVVFDINNIQDTNRLYGHLAGNNLIRDFSDILRVSAYDLCFVGRNGGNKFLAVFEKGTEADIEIFIERVAKKVSVYNADKEHNAILYSNGVAFHEKDPQIRSITDQIALANRRSSEAAHA